MNNKTSSQKLLEEEIVSVNIGLRNFAETIAKIDGKVVHVDWRPTPKRNPIVSDLLAKLTKKG